MNTFSVRARAILVLIVSALAIGGCGQGAPSDELVKKDWNIYAEQTKSQYFGWQQYIALKDVEVVGRKTEGSNATVIIKVTGEWITNNDPGFFAGVGWGFKGAAKGKTQTVERKMYYEKFDRGWQLKDIENK